MNVNKEDDETIEPKEDGEKFEDLRIIRRNLRSATTMEWRGRGQWRRHRTSTIHGYGRRQHLKTSSNGDEEDWKRRQDDLKKIKIQYNRLEIEYCNCWEDQIKLEKMNNSEGNMEAVGSTMAKKRIWGFGTDGWRGRWTWERPDEDVDGLVLRW